MNNKVAESYWRDSLRLESASYGKRWHVAKKAYAVNGYRTAAVKELAQSISQAQGAFPHDPDEKKPTDTVYRLAHAYAVFVELLKMDCKRAKRYRRKYPYTRFDVVWQKWQEHEFEPEKFWEYLDLDGGNRMLAAFIENVEHPLVDWERRAVMTYKQAYKLQTDFGVPDGLHKAAKYFVAEFEKWEKRLR